MDFSCIYEDQKGDILDNKQDQDWEPYEQTIRLSNNKKILFLQQICGHVTLVCSFNEEYIEGIYGSKGGY